MNKSKLNSEQIKAELLKKSLNFTDLASVINCSPSHISNVCSRTSYSSRVAKAVALAIDKPLEAVFGDVDSYFNGPRSEARQAQRAALRAELAKTISSVL